MRTVPRFSIAVAILLLSGPAALRAQTAGEAAVVEYLQAVGEHYGFPYSELEVLRRWNLSPGEIPVVLFVAGRAGVSADVVVALWSSQEDWMSIATRFELHAGDFHVPFDGPRGPLTGVYDRFNERPASQWRDIALSDDEVVGLVNVDFLARYLGVPPSCAAAQIGGAGGMVSAFLRLQRGPGG